MATTPVNTVVVFYSRYGDTEKAALAAGVGAVQARANIRLRRLADSAAAETIAKDARWQEHQERMKADYIAPRPIDIEWADLLILAAPKDATAEMEAFLDSLANCAGKVAAPVSGESFPLGKAAKAGMLIYALTPQSDTIAECRAHGKRAAELARKLKA